MINRNLLKNVDEHTKLCKLLSDAQERYRDAVTDSEKLDAQSEIDLIQEEIDDTERVVRLIPCLVN